MDEHDIRGNTRAAYCGDETSEVVCSCHTLRHQALDGCCVGGVWKVVVALRYSTEALDGFSFVEVVGWKGEPTGDRVRVRWQWEWWRRWPWRRWKVNWRGQLGLPG
jgi:hypothetical protein